MEQVLPRFLSVPSVRNFLLRPVPEGVLPRSSLSTAISFAYAGGQSQPHVRVPSIQDSFVLHTIVDGYALGEMLACSFEHPLGPTLQSVIANIKRKSFATTAVSRRFCIDLNGSDILEYLEFAWMTDSRLLVSYRWTKWEENAPFMMGGEVCMYPPVHINDLRLFSIGIPELRMSITAQNCVGCGATHQSHCVCAPSVVTTTGCSFENQSGTAYGDRSGTVCLDLTTPNPAPPVPIRLSQGKSWAKFCDVFSSCRTMGSLRVIYRVGVPSTFSDARTVFTSEQYVHEGIVPYGISVTSGFPGCNELKQQLHVYMESAGNCFALLEEPKPGVDEGALKLIDHTLSSGEVGNIELLPELVESDVAALESVLKSEDGQVDLSCFTDGPLGIQDSTTLRTSSLNENVTRQTGAQNSDAFSSNSWPELLHGHRDDSATLSYASLGDSFPRDGSISPEINNQVDEKESRNSHGSNTVCSICGAKFTRPSNLRRHRQSLHLHVKKAHQCLSCDRSFFSAVELRRHAAKHDVPRPQCPQCGLRFRLTTALELHMAVVHGKQRPFKCDDCDVAFARKSALDRHRNSVHEGKRHECAVCGASYSQPFDLKRHGQRTGHDSHVQNGMESGN